jgi:hypothetical protein
MLGQHWRALAQTHQRVAALGRAAAERADLGQFQLRQRRAVVLQAAVQLRALVGGERPHGGQLP